MPVHSAGMTGRACPSRPAVGTRCIKTRRVNVIVRAEADTNPFKKIGTQLIKAGSSLTAVLSGTAKVQRKRGSANEGTAFVAGATGRLGAKIVKELLDAGLSVRAACRTQEKGENFINSGKEAGIFSPSDVRRINLVEFDLSDEASFDPAIGNAGLVISALGAPESKAFDVTGPKKIDGDGTIALINAARDAGVKRFILVTSLGTTKFGWPAAALNLFWGVLFWKAQAEAALVKSGMIYTIIRPGGMERPQDDYKETHSTVLYPRDTQFGGQVSRLQVAEVVAACAINAEASGNKTVEVVAQEGGPEPDLEAMLAAIEPEITLEEMKERQAKIADLRNRERQIQAEAEALEEQLTEAEERKVLAEQAYSEARSQLQEVRTSNQESIRESEQSSAVIKQLEAQLEEAQRQEAAAKAVLDAQRIGARSGKILGNQELREITQSVLNPPSMAADGVVPRGAAAGGGMLAGLFGGAAKAAAQDAQEEVEETVQKVEKKAKPAFTGFFGGAKQKAEEVAEEAQAEASMAVAKAEQKAPASPFGGLFGGAKSAAKEASEEVEAAAPKFKQKAQRSVAQGAAQARKGVEEATEEVKEEAKKTVKGGGLFGLFQQDTVFADADDTPAAPPSRDVVERAITKRGMGARKPRRSTFADQSSNVAASVSKRLEKVTNEAEQKASDTKEQAKQAVQGKAPEAEKQTKRAAEKVEKAAEDAGEQAGSFFSGLFGGAAKAFEDLKGPPPKEVEAPKPTASAAAAPKKTVSGGDAGLADKRAAAVASALKNLGTAAKESAQTAKEAAAKPVATAVEKTPETPEERRAEAREWIQNWRKKTKA